MATRAKKKRSVVTRKPKKAKTTKKAKAAKKAKKAGTVPVAKPERAGETHVDFGLHGLGKIMTAIHDAKLGKDFGDHLGPDGVFVKLDRQSLENIKVFVDSKEELAELAEHIRTCDCPPDDPGCVYIPG
jgi:hypothetical protein